MTRGLRITNIRDGGPADLSRIVPLMQASFDARYGEAWTSAQCMGMLALPGSWLTLAERDGELIGFALARSVLDDGELLLIAIDPSHRGTGAGRALLRTVLTQAGSRGTRSFHLEVRANNPALKLYRSEGFVEVGARRDYYRGSCGECFDAITLQKMLP